MLLFTGRRTGEILTLRWEYLDFENSKMHLPDTKTGAKTFHLSSTAKQLLLSLPSKEGFESMRARRESHRKEANDEGIKMIYEVVGHVKAEGSS